jgi:hypothetical protein
MDRNPTLNTHRSFEVLARALLMACSLAGAPNMELGTVLLADGLVQPAAVGETDWGE